ncbi:MAG: hypothetical protein AAB462_03895 [Patescibacteria group bacterium]
MNKKLAIPTVLFLIIVVAGGLIFALNSPTSGSGSSSRAATAASVVASDKGSKAGTSVVVEEPVTKIGTISCLKVKDNDGPQATSCAVGVFDTDGKTYALYSDDPTVVGDLRTGQRIQVTGLLKQQNTEFDIYGVIVVQSIKQL